MVQLTCAELEARDLPSGNFADAPVVPVISPTMKVHLQAVAATGARNGERQAVFAKVGDSITYLPGDLAPLGQSGYNPADPAVAGPYTAYADTVNFFRATPLADGNSFTHASSAAFPGWYTGQALAAAPGEFDAIHPAIALILIGTNDLTVGDVATYRTQLTQLAQTALTRGIMPVLSTLPDSDYLNSEQNVAAFNQAITDLAGTLQVPLWNFWKALQGLPNKGLASDGVHPLTDPAGGGVFVGDGLQYGMNVRNATAEQVLDKVRRVVFQDAPADGGQPDQAVTPWAPLPAGTPVIAVGADVGSKPYVTILDSSGRVLSRFLAFDGSFPGGVRVATADLDGDGFTDVVAAAGPGGGPHVEVFSGEDGSLLASFFAYDASFGGGVSVAAGDADGSGKPELVTGAGPGGGPHVKVFGFGAGRQSLDQRASLFAFDPSFTGGVNVAAGAGLIAAGPATAGGPNVRVFDGSTFQLTLSFYAYSESFTGGVSVAVGDLEGDGKPEIITGAGVGGGPAVAVFDGVTGAERSASFAFDPSFSGGVRVALLDRADGGQDVVAATGPGDGRVHVFRGDVVGPAPDFIPFDGGYNGGIFVG